MAAMIIQFVSKMNSTPSVTQIGKMGKLKSKMTPDENNNIQVILWHNNHENMIVYL